MAGRFKTEEVSLGNNLIVEGEDRSKFFIIAQGQVEVLSKGVHGSDLRIALLTEGEFFGETGPGFRQAFGRDRAHDHALHPADACRARISTRCWASCPT